MAFFGRAIDERPDGLELVADHHAKIGVARILARAEACVRGMRDGRDDVPVLGQLKAEATRLAESQWAAYVNASRALPIGRVVDRAAELALEKQHPPDRNPPVEGAEGVARLASRVDHR